MNSVKIVSVTFTFLILCSCGNKQKEEAAARAAQQQAPQEYPATIVHPQNVELQTVFPANIKGQEDIEIRPRVDGFIEAIYVDEGSVVKKGQSLFKINSPQSQQAVTSAEASVTSARASLSSALLDVERIRPLTEKGIISQVQLDAYINAYRVSEASLEQAEATLRNARATLSWTNVTSPVDGIVGEIPYRLGSLVSSSNVLTTVANITNVYAYFSMNEKALLELLLTLPGRTQQQKITSLPPVSLILADGTQYPAKGRIETIAGVVDITTGSANFRAEFPNRSGLLRSGTSGKVVIPRTEKNVFLIPQKATFAQQDKTLVYVLEGDSVKQQIISTVSTPDGHNYVVTDGLSNGDTIVTDGIATLQNGKKIKVKL